VLVALTETHLAFDDSTLADKAFRGARQEAERLTGVYTDLDLLRRHLGRASLRLGERSGAALLARFRVSFPVAALRRLDASGGWPHLLVGWRERGANYDERRLRPPLPAFGPGPGRVAYRFERAVERLVALAERRGWPLERGWVTRRHVEWEPFVSWPRGAETRAVSYRDPAGLRPVALRHRDHPMQRLSAWLGSSPTRPWEHTPEEVALTDAHVYARLPQGVHPLPRTALRHRLGDEAEDAIYVFGRRTKLVLPYRRRCAVRAMLDQQLGR